MVVVDATQMLLIDLLYVSHSYQCMLCHGYTPDDLLQAVIISIPKD